ncbi:hypothetical protein LTR37_017675 [Vermiconidia calcicola]|uniref:Uncharacterized protein n=1 Tax=Vermiconidia calcicola TaxID=1690605 RepID=A0ACC3MJ93_9PEZI|nr:hypothetical protein LTR37_017675 [Vermiconidia calcicola]
MCTGPNLKAGFTFVRVDGPVSYDDRSAALQTYGSDSATSVLPMILRDGSTKVLTHALANSLNITVASRVHVLEPQRNPAIEDKAIGRAVRRGREQNATNIRSMIEASVERQTQTYQSRKRRLTAGGFGDNVDQVEVANKLLNATFMEKQ